MNVLQSVYKLKRKVKRGVMKKGRKEEGETLVDSGLSYFPVSSLVFLGCPLSASTHRAKFLQAQIRTTELQLAHTCNFLCKVKIVEKDIGLSVDAKELKIYFKNQINS